MTQILNGVMLTIIFLFLGLSFGMGFAIGYNYFHNKTKKVCDLCFREIKKVNELYSKNK